jgi:hypothetical protein
MIIWLIAPAQIEPQGKLSGVHQFPETTSKDSKRKELAKRGDNAFEGSAKPKQTIENSLRFGIISHHVRTFSLTTKWCCINCVQATMFFSPKPDIYWRLL